MVTCCYCGATHRESTGCGCPQGREYYAKARSLEDPPSGSGAADDAPSPRPLASEDTIESVLEEVRDAAHKGGFDAGVLSEKTRRMIAKMKQEEAMAESAEKPLDAPAPPAHTPGKLHRGVGQSLCVFREDGSICFSLDKTFKSVHWESELDQIIANHNAATVVAVSRSYVRNVSCKCHGCVTCWACKFKRALEGGAA